MDIRAIVDSVACTLLSWGFSSYSSLRHWAKSPLHGSDDHHEALRALVEHQNKNSLSNSDWRLDSGGGSSDLQLSAGAKNTPSREMFIRSMLTSFPMWVDGHLALGWLALSDRRHNLAYGSSLAALAISTTRKRSDRKRSEASALKGACYLAVGNYDNAITTLEPLVIQQSRFFRAYEDLVAAYIACGKKELARKTIEKIPVSSRSQQLLVVERYLGTAT